MVLGKLPVPGRPTILITVGQAPTALAESAGGGCVDIFTLIYPFSPLSPILRRRPDIDAVLFFVHGKHLRSCRDGQLT